MKQKNIILNACLMADGTWDYERPFKNVPSNWKDFKLVVEKYFYGEDLISFHTGAQTVMYRGYWNEGVTPAKFGA